ncbi:MAG: hypothetical protein ACYC21_10345 [Eubacteriales bacterium]
MHTKHKRLNRKARLQAAKHWLPTYNGKNAAQGYRKHFGISLLCAAMELQMLGYEISPVYLAQLKADEIRRQELSLQKRRMKELQKQIEENADSNETFYYIAGYTSNGIPFGITWEQVEEEM